MNHTDLRGLPIFAAPTNPPADTAPAARGRDPLVTPTGIDLRRTDRRTTAPPAANPAPAELDWALVRSLRQAAGKELSEFLRTRSVVDPEEERALGERIVADLLRDRAEEAATGAGGTPDRFLIRALHTAVIHSLFGLGRLQHLVDDPELENIEIYGHDHTVLQYADGRIVRGPAVADSDEDLIDTLAFLAARQQANERSFSAANPMLHLRLDGGSRLAASAWISARPTAVIRVHRLVRVNLADLVARAMMGPDVADFLARAVGANKSIVVAGPMAGGKTTLVRALCSEFDPWESVGTIETEFELHLHEMPERHERVHAWEARPGSGERLADGTAAGTITVDEILNSSWRFNLDRIIVGEVRGPEVMAMFNAMSGGTGSLSTVHAPNARAAVERLITLAMGAGAHVTAEHARRQVAQHIDFIVQIGVHLDHRRAKHRYIREIVALEHTGDGQAITDLWVADANRIPRPVHMPHHLAAELGL